MERVLVLNSNYEFLTTVTWRRAITLIIKGRAEAIKFAQKVVTNAERTLEMRVPLVIKLLKLVRAVFKSKVPFSKNNIFVRDNFTCAYCGEKLEERDCTVDHIVPRAKGGLSTWENCICSCRTCNNRKADKTASEAKMFIKFRPTAPTVSEFTKMNQRRLGIDKMLEELYASL